MKNYYEENKVIFKLVEKRETLFRTMEEFEVQHGFITKKNPKIKFSWRTVIISFRSIVKVLVG